MEQTLKIDLTEIEGEGEFPCPVCGEVISPDDGSGEVYDILEIAIKEGVIQRVVVQCKKCGSVIQLEGFGLLEEIDYSDEIFDLDDYLNPESDVT